MFSLDDLQAAWEQSFEKPVIFFKHSNRCSVSFHVKGKLERDYTISAEEGQFYFLNLIEHRDVSNEIANLTGVRHESPQMIAVFKGEVLYQASHGKISSEKLKESLMQAS